MKSPSEIAEEIYELSCGCEQTQCKDCGDVWRNEFKKVLTAERQRQERLIELVDGCTPVIESWAVISVAQAEWKKRWLSEAQQVLREVKGA